MSHEMSNEMSNKMSSENPKPLYKTKKFWLVLLFTIYSLFGWIGVPIIVKDQAVSNLKNLANWDTKIESVIFNPWALSLTISQLSIKDQAAQPQVAFDELYVNFSGLSSLSGTVSFDEISLSKPIVHVDIDKDGQLNFQKAFASDQAPETEPEKEGTSDPIAIFFGLIAINEGQVHLKDQSLGETFNLSLQPLNLALEDFSTDHNDGGDYSFDLSIGQGQSVSWKGQIGIAPFQSKGQITISDIRSDTFWYYVKQYSPYALTKALFSLSSQYEIEFSDARSKLIISNGEFSIDDLQLAETSPKDAFFNLENLALKQIEFDLEKNQVSIADIDIKSPQVLAINSPDAEINILRPLSDPEEGPEEDPSQVNAPSNTDEHIDESKSEGKPFLWSVGEISLNDGLVHWKDQSLETPADIKLEHLAIRLQSLSQDLSKSFPYAVSFSTLGQQHDLSGDVAPLPLAIKGDLNVNKLPLSLIGPYLSNSINAQLQSGEIQLNSEYDLKQGSENPIIGNITNKIAVNNIHLKDYIAEKPFAGFNQFTVSPLSITLQDALPKQIIEIDEVTLKAPYSNIYINPEGEMNLASLSKSETSQADTTEESPPEQVAKQETEEKDKSAPQEADVQENNIQVNKILISNGRFEFTDASQKPAFSTYFDQVGGSINNLSSDIDAHSKVDIQGMLETYGKLLVQGTLNPLSPEPNSLINVDVKNIDLSTASTYSARYAGYQIDKGKLNLDLAYELNDTKLNASNHVFIDQFEFGESVDSPDATALPLPLALGLLKNIDGEIDIDLPISGDISDPSFSIGGIVITAFTNLITKVVTSPFSILGKLVDGGDDISQVKFLANQATIDEAQSANILKLAEVLSKRPKLNLEIRGVANNSIDLNIDEAQLLQLAKNRAQTIRQVLIEQGNVTEQRIFMLEPELVISEDVQKSPATDAEPQYVNSVFTIGIN